MKSVVIKKKEDFEKIDETTTEIEFVEYDDLFSFLDNCVLPNITFTKMEVFLDSLPLSLEKIYLYDCDAEIYKLRRFPNLKFLLITNRKVDINDISNINILEELTLDYCDVVNVESLSNYKNLKKLSLINTSIKNYEFLLDINSLHRLIIDDNTFELNKYLFSKLINNGVLVSDMIGGRYDVV